jgi:hypothetical protein
MEFRGWWVICILHKATGGAALLFAPSTAISLASSSVASGAATNKSSKKSIVGDDCDEFNESLQLARAAGGVAPGRSIRWVSLLNSNSVNSDPIVLYFSRAHQIRLYYM